MVIRQLQTAQTFFVKKVQNPPQKKTLPLMTRFMRTKTAFILIEYCLESKNKYWDLKDLIKHDLFHIHIIKIWRMFKKIEAREKN